jgi:hypothetical protein
MYFDIIDFDEYSKLDNIGCKRHLIEKGVYLEKKEEIENIIDRDVFCVTISPVCRYSNSDFIGSNFTLDNLNYEINNLFLDEVFEVALAELEESVDLIKTKFKTLEIQLELYSKEKVIEFATNLINEKISLLSQNMIQELYSIPDIDDFEKAKLILRKYLIYDYTYFFEYLIGIKNKNSYVSKKYSAFIKNRKELELAEHFKELYDSESEELKISMPMKVALMHDLGFFKTNEFTKLSDADKYKILAYLFDYPFNSENAKRAIRGNYKSLDNITNSVNLAKFTAHTHVGKILNVILNK